MKNMKSKRQPMDEMFNPKDGQFELEYLGDEDITDDMVFLEATPKLRQAMDLIFQMLAEEQQEDLHGR